MSPDQPETLRVLLLVADALEAAGVPYHVGGSFASSVHGTPRQTQDIDFVVDLEAARIDAFLSGLKEGFYADRDAAREAVTRRQSFNLVHLDSGIKADLFVLGTEPFDRAEFERQRLEEIDPDSGRRIPVKSPEDTILRKLLWYRSGGEVSERQWLDVCGIARTQGPSLDRAYLDSWATRLGIGDLLARVMGER